jgi:hypothetical protein
MFDKKENFCNGKLDIQHILYNGIDVRRDNNPESVVENKNGQ